MACTDIDCYYCEGHVDDGDDGDNNDDGDDGDDDGDDGDDGEDGDDIYIMMQCLSVCHEK